MQIGQNINKESNDVHLFMAERKYQKVIFIVRYCVKKLEKQF